MGVMGGMLDTCRQQPEQSVDLSRNMEEWYDPFGWMKKRVILSQGIIAENKPRELQFVEHLAAAIIRK